MLYNGKKWQNSKLQVLWRIKVSSLVIFSHKYSHPQTKFPLLCTYWLTYVLLALIFNKAFKISRILQVSSLNSSSRYWYATIYRITRQIHRIKWYFVYKSSSICMGILTWWPCTKIKMPMHLTQRNCHTHKSATQSTVVYSLF